MQHTKHIVIRSDEQLCRILKRFIYGEPLWVRMAMRADDRQVAYLTIKCAGSLSELGSVGKSGLSSSNGICPRPLKEHLRREGRSDDHKLKLFDFPPNGLKPQISRRVGHKISLQGFAGSYA